MTRDLSAIEGLASAVKSDFNLDNSRPLVVRHGIIRDDDAIDPPLYHPYFELGVRLSGQGSFVIDGVTHERKPYDIFLGGINQPHWGRATRYPIEFITVYFLPGVLAQGAANSDEAMLMLNRFSNRLPPERHLIRPTPTLRTEITPLFQAMAQAQKQQRVGYLTEVQTLLLRVVLSILRWEARHTPKAAEVSGKGTSARTAELDWAPVIRAMQFIRDHATEKLYAADVAREAGVSQTRLKTAFAQTLRMPWITYQQHCRMHLAMLLLKQTDRKVTDIAFEVGFSSMSHFYRTYKAITGQPPPRRG